MYMRVCILYGFRYVGMIGLTLETVYRSERYTFVIHCLTVRKERKREREYLFLIEIIRQNR